MTLALYGKEDLKTLKKFAIDKFSGIKNKDFKEKIYKIDNEGKHIFFLI
jgi:secreted Zn-dependent insulinase-like peptidase